MAVLNSKFFNLKIFKIIWALVFFSLGFLLNDPSAPQDFPQIAPQISMAQQCLAEEFCREECRVEPTYVPDGQCGLKECPANYMEEVECPSACGYPGGVIYGGDCEPYECEATEPCPSPTPTPSLTPSPGVGGGGGKKTSLGANLTCEPDFEVTLDVTDNGNPVEGVDVAFTYDSSTRVVKTNKHGRARTFFGKTINGPVRALIKDYPDQAFYVNLPECEPEVVEVSRLAPTGQFGAWSDLSFDLVPDFTFAPLMESVARQPKPTWISIESANIELPVVESVVEDDVWQVVEGKANHLALSARPGETGNIVIYGHNQWSVFGALSQVEIDDQILVANEAGQTENYLVTSKKIVDQDQTDVILPTEDETLTVYTCTGLADSKRLVVQAEKD